jgi:histidinol-phosphate aminotransferase
LILGGEKTVTATSPWLFEADATQRPLEGGWSLLLDADGRPAAVLRTTQVKTLPFGAVTAADSQYEGPPVRPIEAWRDVHRRYFDRVLAPFGRQWAADMPVTLERFEVACRA